MTVAIRRFIDVRVASSDELLSINPLMIVSLSDVTDDPEDGAWMHLADGRALQLTASVEDIFEMLDGGQER